VEAQFSELYARRADIETRFDGELNWEPVNHRRASMVAIYMPSDVTRADHQGRVHQVVHLQPEKLRAALDSFA
jgi:hypothetical protein